MAAAMASACASSRAPTGASAGVRTTSTCTSVSARPGAPSTTPMPQRVSPGSTPSTRTRATSCSIERSFEAAYGSDGAVAGRDNTPAPVRSVAHVGVRPRRSGAAPCGPARCSSRSSPSRSLGGVLAWVETGHGVAARRLRRVPVRARRLGRLGLLPRVRARLRRLPGRRPQRRGARLPDPQPVQVRAPGAVDPAAAVLHRRRAASACPAARSTCTRTRSAARRRAAPRRRSGR